MSWIDDINKQLEKNRESLRKKGYDEKKLAKKEGNSNGGKVTSEIHKRSGQLEKLHKDEKRIQSVKDYQHSRDKEERSESSKNGWAKEEGYEERREHIVNMNKERADENRELLSKYNQDPEHQAWAGSHSRGGEILFETTYKETVKCPHCPTEGRGMVMKKYHFDKCKQNPNREIIYKYELFRDGESFGKFEEKTRYRRVFRVFSCSYH